jgi:hypothetical protein
MRKEEAFLLEEELAPDSKWEMTQNGKSETPCGAAGLSTVVKKSPTGSSKDHPIGGPKFRPAILEVFAQQLFSSIEGNHGRTD